MIESEWGESESKVSVVVYVIVAEGKILVEKRREGTSFAGELILPGGKVEKGESSEEAVRREMGEEVGVKRSQLEYLGQYRYPEELNMLMGLFLVRTEEEIQSLSGEFFWMEIEEFILQSSYRSSKEMALTVQTWLQNEELEEGLARWADEGGAV